MLDNLPALQESLLPIVKYTLIVLTALFTLLLVIYLVSIFKHDREKRYITRKTADWQSTVQRLLHGEKSRNDFDIPRKERRYFRDVLMAECAKQGGRSKDKIRDLYKQFGFLDDDINQLRSRIWWKKIEAMERIGDLRLIEVEDNILPMLLAKRSEVKFSALRALASIGSQKLAEMLPKIFADNSRWAYRYLVNKLYIVEIPPDNLKPLASSPDRDLRKATAILLGKKGNEKAIPMLRNLADDGVKDVRREAIHSLGEIGSTKAISILSNRIDDDEPQVRAEIARALGKLKDLNSLSLIDQLADDIDFEVRFQAFFALERFGQPGEDIIRTYQAKYPEIAEEFLSKSKNGNLN